MFDTLTRMGSSAAGAYEIERSLRFNGADTAKLERAIGAGGSTTQWTMSLWVKRSTLSTAASNPIFGYMSADTNYQSQFRFNNNNLEWYRGDYAGGGGWTARRITNRKFRDSNAWYHLVFVWDSPNNTAGDRMKIYVNGVQETSFSATTDPSQSLASFWNSNNTMAIGTTSNYNDGWFNGYIAEVNFIDGAVKQASDFGETDSDTGAWVPKKYAGSYGTTGFYLNFSDNSNTTSGTLGADSSANSNDWTPTNFSVSAGTGNDSFEDTPTNNYCILSPLSSNATTLNNGNLYWVGDTGTANFLGAKGSFGIKSGKWYWEHTCTTAGYSLVGIKPADKNYNNPAGDDEYADGAVTYAGWSGSTMLGDGTTGTSWETYGNTWTTNDVIGIAFDADNNAIYFSKNGTWQNSATAAEIAAGTTTNAAYTGLTSEYYPLFTSYSSGAGHANFGQRPFIHTAPTGFKTLCSKNLPEPTIKLATDHFNTVLYTGTGAEHAITGVGFSPDLVWTKGRSDSDNNSWFDTVRGATKELVSNGSGAEAADAQLLKSFDSDGFTLGTNAGVNGNTETYVSWNWKESATAGFDIVSYTGTGSAQNVSHTLGVAPEMIITKNRDSSYHWGVYHHSLTDAAENHLTLSDDGGTAGGNTWWNDTAPTSSVFTVLSANETNKTGDDYIAYLFSSVEGYSKIGSFTGN